MSLPSERPSPERKSRAPGPQYYLRAGHREFPIEPGETVVGRGDGCHLIVNENLVSRRHARILNESAGLFIEDLGSANGTFLNQSRVRGRHRLAPGDHVFVGTLEIQIVAGSAPLDFNVEREALEDRETPASGVGVVDAQRSTSAPSSGKRALSPDPTADATVHANSLEYLGRLADKMFTLGRIDAARRILSLEIERLVDDARQGRPPTADVVDIAGVYAVKLANETLEARWVNAALELHWMTCRPMREETIQRLAALRGKAPLGSEQLIARYYERLRANLAFMSTEERMLTERVACLLPSLD